jgi:hypothetical protein
MRDKLKAKAAVAGKRSGSTLISKAELPSAKKQVVFSILLVIATLAVYFPVSHHPFVNFDDTVYVVDNPHIQSGLDWETISWAFSTLYQFNWHPLTWLSHAMDVQIYQLEPGGHHVTNLIWQVLNVLLLFWVLANGEGDRVCGTQCDGCRALCPAPDQC